MKRAHARVLGVLAAVFALAASSGAGDAAAPSDWPQVWERCRDAGLDAGQVRELRRQCEQSRLSIPSAARLMQPLWEAEAAGVPADPIGAKLGEGLAKGVPAEQLEAAVRARFELLVRSRGLVQTGFGVQPPPASLVLATAMAMESGVAEGALSDLLSRAAGRSADHVAGIVQTGEMMQLAGIDSDTVQATMRECLERNLRRTEMVRAARFLQEQHRRGVDGGAARQALWGGEHAVEAGSRTREKAQSGRGVDGTGIGPGLQDATTTRTREHAGAPLAGAQDAGVNAPGGNSPSDGAGGPPVDSGPAPESPAPGPGPGAPGGIDSAGAGDKGPRP